MDWKTIGGLFVAAVVGAVVTMGFARYQEDSAAGDNAAIAAAPVVVQHGVDIEQNAGEIVDLKIVNAKTLATLQAIAENQDRIYRSITGGSIADGR